MSEKNVELHRRAVEAFNARNIEAFIACCDPSIELHSTVAAVGGGVYKGDDGLRRWHRDLEEAVAEIGIEVEAYFELESSSFGHETGLPRTRRGATVLAREPLRLRRDRFRRRGVDRRWRPDRGTYPRARDRTHQRCTRGVEPRRGLDARLRQGCSD